MLESAVCFTSSFDSGIDVFFRTGKNDDVCNPSGDRSAGIYDGFSETQTESQVWAIPYLDFIGCLKFAWLKYSDYLICMKLCVSSVWEER